MSKICPKKKSKKSHYFRESIGKALIIRLFGMSKDSTKECPKADLFLWPLYSIID